MNNKKVIKYSVIALVIVIIGLLIAKKQGFIETGETISVSTEVAKLRTITETISANGTIEPETQIKISPDVSGEIVELNIKEGDKVTKGQLLVKIKPEAYLAMSEKMEATLNNAKSNLGSSKARYIQAKAKFKSDSLSYKRKEQLWYEKLISKEEFEVAESQYLSSKSEVDANYQNVLSAQFSVKSTAASLKESNDNLLKTNIFSPADGTISSLLVEKGERVVGTTQFAGTEILKIANLQNMIVKTKINENDILKVNIGDTAKIEIDAYLNRKFLGVVTEISSSANITGTTTEQVTNFNVEIRILPESYKDLQLKLPKHISPFKPGMSASVEINTKTVFKALSVPIQSVTTRDDTSSLKKIIKKDNKTELFECVFIYKDGKVKLQKVVTGIQDQDYIQIIQGLKNNDEIINAPYTAISKDLYNGVKVKKVKEDELYTY